MWCTKGRGSEYLIRDSRVAVAFGGSPRDRTEQLPRVALVVKQEQVVVQVRRDPAQPASQPRLSQPQPPSQHHHATQRCARAPPRVRGPPAKQQRLVLVHRGKREPHARRYRVTGHGQLAPQVLYPTPHATPRRPRSVRGQRPIRLSIGGAKIAGKSGARAHMRTCLDAGRQAHAE